MSTQTESEEELTLIKTVKKYRLNPSLFKPILYLRVGGFNNIEISKKTGINKNTINKYIKTSQKISIEDMKSIIRELYHL